MRMIDCYWIRQTKNGCKCTKIHGVGIAYNVCKSAVYIKCITIASGMLSIPPIGLMLGMGVGQGFVKAAINTIKGGVL